MPTVQPYEGLPRGYGEQDNLPVLLMRTWEHEEIFIRELGIKKDSGVDSEFLLRKYLKIIPGNKEYFGNFLGSKGT